MLGGEGRGFRLVDCLEEVPTALEAGRILLLDKICILVGFQVQFNYKSGETNLSSI